MPSISTHDSALQAGRKKGLKFLPCTASKYLGGAGANDRQNVTRSISPINPFCFADVSLQTNRWSHAECLVRNRIQLVVAS
jgi:hypothetical protein